jgi:hypothetical protein
MGWWDGCQDGWEIEPDLLHAIVLHIFAIKNRPEARLIDLKVEIAIA